MGDAIFGNLILLGHAWQQGLVPVSLASLTRAIELNGVAVDANLKAFLWGRRLAHDRAAVERFARPAAVVELPRTPTLDDLVARRAAYLTDYQDAAYAGRYRALVEQVRAAEARLSSTRLAETVARNYFKLLAVKDEYEVARLHADPAFQAKIAAIFEGDYRLNFHLAPPLLAKTDPATGLPRKRAYGPWMLTAFGWLAKLKFLRGGALDVFGKSAERRLERALLAAYEADLSALSARLGQTALGDAIALARLPEKIRGFGHVKLRSMASVAPEHEALRKRLGLA
jgi:indolepyruvate ferredoxin oxidoreductase